MIRAFIVGPLMAMLIMGCASNKPFNPKSSYPPDPWVKGYSNPDDCLGGEKLAARAFALPEYPSRAYRQGVQGWVIVKLDITQEGVTQNVSSERSVPEGSFDSSALQAVKLWRFDPPQDGALQNCRVLLRYRAGTVSLGG